MIPPTLTKKAEEYAGESISKLSRQEYLEFFENFFAFLKRFSKKTARLAFINADWRDFQNRSATEEDPKNSILLVDYCKILENAGWALTHIIQAPTSSERFDAVVVSAMQKKRILGVTSQYVIVLK